MPQVWPSVPLYLLYIHLMCVATVVMHHFTYIQDGVKQQAVHLIYIMDISTCITCEFAMKFYHDSVANPLCIATGIRIVLYLLYVQVSCH